ncbi:MAG: NAD(P)/FAD-dependent oxidoreductase [Opitutaceae bacterium]
MSHTETITDALIIGGGPAGSCAGAALAQAGLQVRIIETSDFSKPRIGESLLPNGNRLFKHIGVWDKIEAAGFVQKFGAEFETPDGSKNVHNIFAKGLISNLDYTYQVERPRFDKLLLEHATELGCKLDTTTKIQSASQHEDYIEVITTCGQKWKTKWLLDASGRRRFLGKLWKLPTDTNQYPSRVAIYNHFKDFKRASGKEGGNIIITRKKDGWFWQIPISETITSVGCVSLSSDLRAAKLGPNEWFEHCVQKCPAVAKRLDQAHTLNEFSSTTDYTHMFRDFCGPRYFLIGDAATFTDPIFSSGVYLSMESAIAASQAIIQSSGSLSTNAQKKYTRTLKQRTKVVRELIDIFYSDSGFAVFMNPTDKFQLFAAVNAIVAGNTKLTFGVRWRYALFKQICRINRDYRLVPKVL